MSNNNIKWEGYERAQPGDYLRFLWFYSVSPGIFDSTLKWATVSSICILCYTSFSHHTIQHHITLQLKKCL